MIIQYDNNPIRKRCEKATGKLKQRLDDIHAAADMSVLRTLPGKHHALSANLAGNWACHIEEPYRLVYQPLGDPLPISEDGHLDLSKVVAVTILGVTDYHGK